MPHQLGQKLNILNHLQWWRFLSHVKPSAFESLNLLIGIHLICANNACCDFFAWNGCHCCSCFRLLHLHSCLFHWSNLGQWVDFGICGYGEWFYLTQLLTVDLRFIEIPGNCISNVLFQSLSSNKKIFNTGFTSCKSC